jgi:hypothetical protein
MFPQRNFHSKSFTCSAWLTKRVLHRTIGHLSPTFGSYRCRRLLATVPPTSCIVCQGASSPPLPKWLLHRIPSLRVSPPLPKCPSRRLPFTPPFQPRFNGLSLSLSLSLLVGRMASGQGHVGPHHVPADGSAAGGDTPCVRFPPPGPLLNCFRHNLSRHCGLSIDFCVLAVLFLF